MNRCLNLLVTLLALLAIAAAGCSAKPAGSDPPDGSQGNPAGAITVSAAASLTDPFKAIGADFRRGNAGVTSVSFNFDSSATLASQVRAGAPADVFASADEANMEKLVESGLVEATPQIFARNRLAIVVKKGNPKNVRTLADLPDAGTLALSGSDVPIGRYASQMLAAAGVRIPEQKITRTKDVKATVTAVSDGDADAGIVYVTDIAGSKVEGVVIPDAQNVVAKYPIAVLKNSSNENAARAFVDFVLSPAGQEELRSAGFMAPA